MIVLLSLFGVAMTLHAQIDTAWARLYPAQSGSAIPKCIAADDSGNVYASGYNGPGGWWIVKCDVHGDTLWSRAYPGSGYMRSMAVDGQGNVCITGTTRQGGGPISLTVSWDRIGNFRWGQEYIDFSAEGYGVAADRAGNFYVAGMEEDSIYYYYAMVLKYDAAGSLVWSRRYDADTEVVGAYGVAVDSAGVAYVAATDHYSLKDHALLLRYSPGGDLTWVQRYIPTGPRPGANARFVAIDHGGNPVIAGSGGDSLGSGFITIKYGPGGNRQWVVEQDVGSTPAGLAIDDSNNVFLIGTTNINGTGHDWATMKISPAGETLWHRRVSSSSPGGHSDDEVGGIAINRFGRIYVTGTTEDTSYYNYISTVRYDEAGHQLWMWSGFYGHYNGGSAMATDDSGDVYSLANVGGLQGRAAVIRYLEYRTQHDVGCIQIVAPLGSVDSGAVIAPVCTVYNFGSVPESYRVRMSIGGGYNETAFVSAHQPNTTQGVVFPNWTATQRGRNTVICATELADDSNPTNDARTDSVIVRTAAIDESNPTLDFPNRLALAVRPNPARFGAVIAYSLPARADVRLAAYDISGKLVRALVQGTYSAGQTTVAWDRTDAARRVVASGVYFIRLQAGGRTMTRRLTIQ
jgi:hypothetical protein